MFPLWDVAIAPVLRAAQARRVVEIGALRGETTRRMLEDLGSDAELDVIDPEPEFDPMDLGRQFPGRYRFHRGLSLDVLPTLGPVDAALIDGDHNWYTVFNELRLLAEGGRRHCTGLPLLVLHDVLWPYGRRDLYYAPERIPAGFRQPFARAGVNPGMNQLHPRRGVNLTMWNAEQEGGPRNGVMTALEDFLAEYPRPVRKLVLPIYFGLAIVVEEERLAARPDLEWALERLESREGRHDLLEVAEATRLRAVVVQHTERMQRDSRVDRAVARYLAVVKGALLDRRDHERESLAPRDPDDAALSPLLADMLMGMPQLDHLETALDAVRRDGIAGDLVACGRGRGAAAIFMRAYLEAHELDGTRVWVVDGSTARREPEPVQLPGGGRGGCPAVDAVHDALARFDLLDDRVRLVTGPVAATAGDRPDRIALLRIDRPAASDARSILDALYDRVTGNGVIIVDCGLEPGARTEVEEFRAHRLVDEPLQPIDDAVAWRKAPTAR